MARISKEEDILELFFNEPTKHWHFSKIREKVPIAENKISKWLKKFQKEKFIKRIKEKKKQPYYIGNHEAPEYRNTKKLFALKKFHQSGLLNHLASLEKAETIVIFGSFSRSDWYTKSDIDIFIYGNADDFDLWKYQKKLHNEIQLFHSENKKDLSKYSEGLMKNIIKGYFIKGNLDFLEVKANA